MTEKKKFDENQVWSLVMMIMPVIILGNIGSDLGADYGMPILYAALGGGVGGLLGGVANHLTKDKGRLVKAMAVISLFLVCVVAMKYAPTLTSKISEKEIKKQEWLSQSIGGITFKTPEKLLLQEGVQIPESVMSFYAELKTYSNQDDEKAIVFINSKLTESGAAATDTLTIENSFLGSLQGILKEVGVNLESLEVEPFTKNSETVSATFSYEINGNKVKGHGFMFKTRSIIDMIWLLPVKKSLSEEYLTKFKSNISHNQQ